VADGHERGHELASEYVRAVMVAHSGHLDRPGAGFPDSCSSAVTGCSETRSGLFLNKSDGVFHASEHAVLTATKALSLGGR
jgi:hypothetical protein